MAIATLNTQECSREDRENFDAHKGQYDSKLEEWILDQFNYLLHLSFERALEHLQRYQESENSLEKKLSDHLINLIFTLRRW